MRMSVAQKEQYERYEGQSQSEGAQIAELGNIIGIHTGYIDHVERNDRHNIANDGH